MKSVLLLLVLLYMKYSHVVRQKAMSCACSIVLLKFCCTVSGMMLVQYAGSTQAMNWAFFAVSTL